MLVAIFFFSTVEVAARYIYHLYGVEEINHYQIAFLRFFFGSLFIFLYLLARGELGGLRRALRESPLQIILLGVLGIYVTFSLYYWGLERTSASTAAIVFSTNPIFTAAIAIPLLREKVDLRIGFGFLLGLAGAYLAVTGMCLSLPLHRGETQAGIAVLLSAVTWALYTALGKRHAQRYGEAAVSFLSMSIGSLLFLFTLMLRNEIKDFGHLHLATWLIMAYVGIFTVGIGYLFYFGGLKRVPAASGASMFFLKPSIAVLLAWLLLNEPATRFIAPLFFSTTGILFATYRREAKEWVED